MQIYKALKKETVTRRRCPQQNRCVISNRLNSRRIPSESRRWRSGLFHRRGPATVNERSPRLVQFNCRQTDMDKPGNVLSYNAASQLFGSYLCTHSRPPAHIKGSVASLHNTCVGTAPASCIPGVAVLAVLALVV